MMKVGPSEQWERTYPVCLDILFDLSSPFMFVLLCVDSSAKETEGKGYKLEASNNRNLSLLCSGAQMSQS